MCGNLLVRWLVPIACVCGVAGAGEPAPGPVADANETWLVADHLVADWQFMALTTRRYNPAGPVSANKTPHRYLSFAGRVDVIDTGGLIGLSELATDAQAFDELGNPIDTTRVSQYPTRYTPLRYSTTIQLGTGYRITEIVPYEFTIDMTMERNAPFPLMLSRLEWSMSALLSDDFETIDITFAPTADWIELALGLEILVEKAIAAEGKYEYRIQARYDPNEVTYLDARDRPAGFMGRRSEAPYSWPTNIQPVPKMIVTAIDVVDANGTSLPRSGGSGGFDDSGGQRIVTRSADGFCPTCGNAAFIRHVIAFDPYDRKLQFVLENVPVPTE